MSGALRELLRKKLAPFAAADRFVVGYSGGADSHSLLHALVSLELPQSILALHVNHGLSPHASEWEKHCESVAETLGVHFCAESVRVVRDGTGLENAARQARYDLFSRHIGCGDLLLLAHHSDDQLETFFLRVLRGAGVRGLGGMPDWRMIGDGSLLRPWLSCTREEIRAYAVLHQLHWVDDETNEDLQFDRNFLREDILPRLQSRWPQASQSIARSMSWCGEADAVADELAEIDFFACYPHPERLGWSLSLGYLRGLSRARRRNVLRLWLTRCQVALPGHRVLDAIQDQAMESRPDAVPQVSWGDWQCRRYQGRLHVMPQLPTLETDKVWQCHVADVIHGAGFGEVSFSPSVGEGMRLDSDKPLTIAFSREGIRCRPVGRHHSQTLKKLFQAASIPPWLRDRTPLVYQEDQLLAVGDWWVCADAAVEKTEPGFVLQWEL